jgi:hypothetical protein
MWCDGMQFGRCGNVLEDRISHCIQHYIQEEGSNHNNSATNPEERSSE